MAEVFARVAAVDERFVPAHRHLPPELVGERQFLLPAPERFSPSADVLEGDVVEQEVFSVMVPYVEVEHSAHVNVASKTAGPLCLPEPSRADEDEGLRPVGFLLVTKLNVRGEVFLIDSGGDC